LIYLEDLTGRDDEDYLDRNLAGDEPDPLSALEDAELRQVLVKAIENLPDREKMMMALYYEEDLNLREIGEVLGVTESRVCQMHSQAVARLRAAVVGEGEDKPLVKRRGRRPRAAA
jgi:RNA polymerase sigma factor for flagellar operon FliA